MSIRRQCELLGLSRASLYYASAGEGAEDLAMMGRIDREYTERPFYGSRRMTAVLRSEGYAVNRKRVRRLMGVMGLEAIYAKPRTTVAGRGHRVYPYLLRGGEHRPGGPGVERGHHVPSDGGRVHVPGGDDRLVQPVRGELAAVEHAGRVVLHRDAGRRPGDGEAGGVQHGPGVQFTADGFTSRLATAGVAIRMDGRGRCLDNVFVERLWRSVKYEDVYLRGYETVPELERGLAAYFRFYNEGRFHQSLEYQTPAHVYRRIGSTNVDKCVVKKSSKVV